MLNETIRADFALRTISDDGSFRVLIANTTHTANGILQAQGPDSDLRKLFLDQITATILLRLTMSPDYRLQTILQNPHAGSLVVDSIPDGTTRGMLRRPLDAPFSFGEKTHFAVHRAMFGGDLHQGIVETSSHQNLSDVVTGYLHRSEQISSVVALAHHFEETLLIASGGYIIQLLPHSDHASLALMTARLEQMPPASSLFQSLDYDLHQIAAELFGPIGYHTLGTDDFHYGCTCSEEKILDALATLPPADIEELKSEEEFLEIGCDYCNTTIRIDPERL